MSCDLAGPVLQPAFWELDFFPSGSEQRLFRHHETYQGKQQTIELGAVQVPLPNPAAVVEGGSVDVTIRIVQANGQAFDSTTTPGFHWSNTSTLWKKVDHVEQIVQFASVSQTDKANMAAAATNTQVVFPGLGGAVTKGIGALIQGVPPQFTNRHGSTLISGIGSFSRGVEPYRLDGLGIEWHWHTVPPRSGKLFGNPDEYLNRVVQWRLISQDTAGQLFQQAVIDSFREGDRYTWGIDQPVTLEYDVSPGWVVELAFLVTAFA